MERTPAGWTLTDHSRFGTHVAGRRITSLTLAGPTTGYVVVYCVEVVLLLATLVALGPLVRGHTRPSARVGLSELPI